MGEKAIKSHGMISQATWNNKSSQIEVKNESSQIEENDNSSQIEVNDKSSQVEVKLYEQLLIDEDVLMRAVV